MLRFNVVSAVAWVTASGADLIPDLWTFACCRHGQKKKKKGKFPKLFNISPYSYFTSCSHNVLYRNRFEKSRIEVPTVVQQDWEHWDTSTIPGLAQWFKDLALLQLWLGSHSWTGNSICHRAAKKEKKKSGIQSFTIKNGFLAMSLSWKTKTFWIL